MKTALDARREGHLAIRAGASAQALSTGLALILGTASISLAVRFMGAARYGVLAFAVSTVGLLSGAIRLGLDMALPQRIAASSATGNRRSLTTAIRGSLILATLGGLVGGIAAVALITASGPAVGQKPATLAVGMGIFLVGSHACWITSSIARGMGRMFLMELPNIALSTGKFLCIVGILLAGYSSIGAISVGYAIAGLVAGLIALQLLRNLTSGITPSEKPAASQAGEMLKYSWPFALVGISAIAISRFDVFILGLTKPGLEVGQYEPILRVTEQLMLAVPLMLVAPYLPVAARLTAAQDLEGFRNLYREVSRLALFLTLPAVITLSAFPEAVPRLLYGSHFPVNRTTLLVLVAGLWTHLCFGFNGAAVAALGDRRRVATIAAVGLMSMVGFALVLIPSFGAPGAAVATAGAYVVMNIASSWHLFRSTGAHPFHLDQGILAAGSLIAVAAAVALSSWLSPLSPPAALATTVCVWLAAVMALWHIPAARIGDLLHLLAPGSQRRLGGDLD